MSLVSCLLMGNDFDYLIFKVAFHYAEAGKNVWVISPKAFDRVPASIKQPDKEILKLITFVYLQNYEDLLKHLNGIHLWQKTPSLIILKGFKSYCDFSAANYNYLRSAAIVANLLNSLSTCSRKNGTKSFLLLTCSELDDRYKERLQILIDLYFLKVAYKIEDNVAFNDVVNTFSQPTS